MLPLVTGESTPLLLTKTQPVVDPLAPEIQALLPKMIKTMHKEHGVGLAAPQIGISLRLAVAEVDEKVYYFINPEIVSKNKIIGIRPDFIGTLRQLADGNENKFSFHSLRLVINSFFVL